MGCVAVDEAAGSLRDSESDGQDLKRVTIRISKRTHARLWAAKILKGVDMQALAERAIDLELRKLNL